jgi:hypothetical protein
MLLDYHGFDYCQTADLPSLFTAIAGGAAVSTGTPRSGTRCLLLSAATDTVRQGGFANQAAHVLGFGIRCTALPAADAPIAEIMDGANVQGQLVLTPTGTLKVYRGAGVALLGTSAVVITAGTWYYIELRYIVDPAVGSSDVHVDGVAKLAIAGANTRQTANTYANGYRLAGDAALFHFDDVYFVDGVNSSPGPANNNFLGPVQCVALVPDGDGATNQFTQDSGANRYSRVNEVPSDGDTSYVSSSTIGDRQLLTTGNLASLTGSVFGVKVVASMRKDDATARTAKVTVHPSANNYDSAAYAISAAWAYYGTGNIWPYNPETLLAWTPTTVNGAQIGVKNES